MISTPLLAQRFAERAGLVDVTPPVLIEALARARVAWPSVELSEDEVLEHWAVAAKRLGEPSFLTTAHLDDLYLACGVARALPSATEAFERAFISRVGEYVVRVTTVRDAVEEVKQLLRLALTLGNQARPKILEYSGKGPLGGWVRMAAIRTAMNLQRSESPEEGERDEVTPAVALDPELAFLKAQARTVFQQAFHSALAQLSAEERSLLRLHYVDGLTLDQLAPMFQTSRSSVARRVSAVRQTILQHTTEHLRGAHQLSASEIESLVAGAATHLQRTLSVLIKP